jgi:hypothetical protein
MLSAINQNICRSDQSEPNCYSFKHQNMLDKPEEEVLDLVIIGAGPHALSLVARILESSPSSVVSDLEHSRISYIKSQNKLGRSGVLDAEQIKVRGFI